MTYGDDAPLDELRREVQQLKSQQIELSAEIHSLRAQLIGLRETLERMTRA